MSEKKLTYKLRYKLKVEPGEWGEEHGKDYGLTDSFMGVSLIKEGGSMSAAFMTFGETQDKDWEPLDLFHVWMMLCHKIADLENLDPGPRSFAKSVWEGWHVVMEEINKMEDEKPKHHF